MKIEVTQEQYEFLKNLQHELLTQPTDGNADPVFWGVIEEKEIGVPDGCGEPRIYLGDGVVNTLEEAVAYVDEWIEDCDDETKNVWDDVDKEWSEDVVDFIKTYIDMQCRLVSVDKKRELSDETGAFLTKRACQEYIDKYGYNHTNPHTYAMTAFRNYEYDELINILKTINFDN